MKIFKIGARAFIVLGALHLLAHIFSSPEDPMSIKLLQDMENCKINILGEHNFLKFYNGFSISMGVLLSAFGLQCLILSEFILENRKALYTTIIITAIVFALSIAYFHIVAYGFTFFSLICFLYALVKTEILINTKISNR
ncbi:MAG: hypothetical protein PHS59_00315 [Paludibacter sp.]|nr:hypothetical protein [Paludibacter sp.]